MEQYAILGVAAIPFIYYFLAVVGTLKYFSEPSSSAPSADFTPPVSCLKPVRGLDDEAYENFASFCRQDYPEYEILFCVDENDDAIPILRRLMREYPHVSIRLLYGPDHEAINDKVARLDRLSREARYEVLVLVDADVRVEPNYLRSVVAPLRDPKVGAATCFYSSIQEKTFTEKLQEIGMMCDFFPGILVAWMLDGVKFGFGQTIATTRTRVEGFGGFQAIENRPADDLLTCRLIAEQGFEVKLLPYVVHTTPDFRTLSDLFIKRSRWMTVMRNMRPWGHLGLIFTFGLPWALLAVAVAPTTAVAASYLGGYFLCRVLLTWLVGIRGLKEKGLWQKMLLIPIWDASAFLIWLSSFARRTIRWRGVDYVLRDGILKLAVPENTQSVSPQPES